MGEEEKEEKTAREYEWMVRNYVSIFISFSVEHFVNRYIKLHNKY